MFWRNRNTTRTTNRIASIKGFDDFVDRSFDEAGRVERHLVAQPVGKALREALHRGVDRRGDFQCIGAGLEVDADRDSRRAVERGNGSVVQGAELDPSDVLHAQRRTVLVRAQDDLLEFARVDQLSLGRDRIGEGLMAGQGLLAEPAGGKLRILLANGCRDIAGDELVLRDLVGTQPNAHRIVGRTEQRGIANSGRALQLVDDIDERVVGNVERVVPAVRRRHRQHLQERGRPLGDGDALPPDFLRQQRQRALNAIVDVDRCLVGIGSACEQDGQGHRARAVRGRLHVDHAFDPVDLLLQWGRDGFGDRLSAGTRIGRRNHHFGGDDFRILRDRQHPHRDQPASKMTIETTVAKIGRSMKNFDITGALLAGHRVPASLRLDRWHIFHRSDFFAGANANNTVDDDPFAGFEAFRNDPVQPDLLTQSDGSNLGDIVGANDVDKRSLADPGSPLLCGLRSHRAG